MVALISTTIENTYRIQMEIRLQMMSMSQRCRRRRRRVQRIFRVVGGFLSDDDEQASS